MKKQNPEEDPILIVSISGKADLKDMLAWSDSYLLDQLRFLPGVGEVTVGGFADRNLRVWIDTQKLNQFDLTITDIVNAFKSQHVESAAGQFVEKLRELRVRWLGEASTIEEVKNIRILKRGGGERVNGRKLYIKDVAEVVDGDFKEVKGCQAELPIELQGKRKLFQRKKSASLDELCRL